MLITLEGDEVREILIEAFKNKIAPMSNIKIPVEDDFYFTIINSEGEVADIEEVKFTAVL